MINILRFMAASVGGMLLYLAALFTIDVFMANLGLDVTLTADDRQRMMVWSFMAIGLAFGSFWFAFGRRS